MRMRRSTALALHVMLFASTARAGYLIRCEGSSDPKDFPSAAAGAPGEAARLRFRPAAGGALEPIRPGECSWLDRALRSRGEPSELCLTPEGAGAKPLVPDALRAPGASSFFEVTDVGGGCLSVRPVSPPDDWPPVGTPAYRSAARPDDLAVVVGIERYSGLPDARFAERDAAAMRRHFLALGLREANIKFIAGASATKSGIEKLVESWLPRAAKKGSTVYFYFSGHGAPKPESGEGYLVPWDGDPEYLDKTAYPLKRLYAELQGLKAGHALVMLDSCFSGRGERSVLAKGIRPLVAKAESAAPASGKLAVLTAAGADQVSGVQEERQHGLFTYHLLKGLNGGASDSQGHVTVRALYDYLKPSVEDDAARSNRDQTPQLLAAPSGPAGGLRLR